jgi:pyroglutamyl-peptidase
MIIRRGQGASAAGAEHLSCLQTLEFGMSATFLVTGFEPFAEHRTNPSWDAIELLRPAWPASISVRRLPVDYRAAHLELREAIASLAPRAVLCTGLARGDVFRIERRARRPQALASVPGEPESPGRWPWDEMRAALDAAGAPWIDSEDAGQYVCESTYWSLLNLGDPPRTIESAAFLHVPSVSERCPLPMVARAGALVVEWRLHALEGSPVA